MNLPQGRYLFIRECWRNNHHLSGNLNTMCKGCFGDKQVIKPRQKPQIRCVVIIALKMFPKLLSAADKIQETMNSAS